MNRLMIAAITIVVILLSLFFLSWLLSGSAAQPTQPAPVTPQPVQPVSIIAQLGLKEGDAIRCTGRNEIYKIENGTKRWYPNPAIYQSWGSPPYKALTCDKLDLIPTGANMPAKA